MGCCNTMALKLSQHRRSWNHPTEAPIRTSLQEAVGTKARSINSGHHKTHRGGGRGGVIHSLTGVGSGGGGEGRGLFSFPFVQHPFPSSISAGNSLHQYGVSVLTLIVDAHKPLTRWVARRKTNTQTKTKNKKKYCTII